ncbi:bifunctional transcriptional activator/DNA repair enzyme protein Ada [Terrihabitans soli]|uniref:methylated-DNA--[protein]-cysteine S-methyltransferase n=1 Tax=Terrihabitans soli TaxID=708113 RepID=A0A6S6QU04_9HYPH|nr:bifunctional DNA-binding transcriptional regulator/O6-methylguanine-DNA methyltransferase Ada [Terrihabitans soli]BCJ90732.1 bifunctional transcriptional activator/DNA repair enzyme protein Ada [Terrihabitans soli]
MSRQFESKERSAILGPKDYIRPMNITSALPADQDPRWQSVIARDRSADGSFFFSVASTGIYCRPSCPARRPKPENVRFFASAKSAEAAGFRACKRCRPERPESWQQNSEIIAQMCRLIESADDIPDLDALAKKAGFSPYHFHRLFKAATGVTPRNYALAHRAKRLREGLTQGASVTDAIYGAGYGSASRFYETSDRVLGMKPTEYRSGGINTEIRYAMGNSSLGKILVAQTERGVCAIFLDDDADAMVTELKRRFPKANISAGGADFKDVVAKVVAFAEKPNSALDLPLDLQGTAFQQRVWNALREIPPGETRTYGEIAKKIGKPDAVRAVGTACGANHVSLAVPCHRVVGITGALTGYRWGVQRKKTLLEREKK